MHLNEILKALEEKNLIFQTERDAYELIPPGCVLICAEHRADQIDDER